MTRVLGSRYELGRPLGVGGMAEIFEANDTRLARRVAIKILRTDLPDPRALERFEREARIAARFNHPNAVTIYDVGDDGSRPYIVMELVVGRSLAELLRERGPLVPDAAVSIMSDVLRALSAAHDIGVVHRDVKPGNILVGDDGRVKLADFGIAKAMSDASAGLTVLGQVIGTPRYLSPEQMRGAAATPRSDQYSSGIVLYEMLTGSIPVADETVVAAGARRESPAAIGSLPPLRSRRPDAPAWLGGIVDRSVAFDPADRFDDVGAMRAALAARGSGAGSTRGTARSNAVDRTQILDASPGPQAPRATVAAPASATRGGSGKAWMLAVGVLVTIIAAGSAAIAWSQSGGDGGGAASTTVARPASTTVAPTTRPLSTTVASTVVSTAAPTTIAATTVASTVATTVPTTIVTTTTSAPTTTTSPRGAVDIGQVIDRLAVDPFSYGQSGPTLLDELGYARDLSQGNDVVQLRKAVDATRADIVKWLAERSIAPDIGRSADQALVSIRR